MRQDVARTKRNAKYEDAINDIMKGVRSGKKEIKVSKAYSVIDKAVKMRVIHANRADRLKRRVSRLINSK